MKMIIFVTLALAVCFLPGCTTSRVETDYGTSVKLARFNQTLDLYAEKNVEPVEGMDGQASQRTVETYIKSFEKPVQAPSSIILGISGGGK